LLDKIAEFSRDLNGYYRKEQVIENATNEWISTIQQDKWALENIVITFDNVFQFMTPFVKLNLLNLPTLNEIKSSSIKIMCFEEETEISDYEIIYLTEGYDKVIKNIVDFLNGFLGKVIKILNKNKDNSNV